MRTTCHGAAAAATGPVGAVDAAAVTAWHAVVHHPARPNAEGPDTRAAGAVGLATRLGGRVFLHSLCWVLLCRKMAGLRFAALCGNL